MTLHPDAPVEYLIGHIEDAFARDPRLSEHGLRVTVNARPLEVVITGTVVAGGHREAIEEIVHELLPDASLCDETTLADYPESDHVEHLS